MVIPDNELAELFDPSNELDQKTRTCLKNMQNAEQMVCTDLLHVVDENSIACEDLVRHWNLRTARLRTIIQTSRSELDFSSPRLSSNIGTIANALLPNEVSNDAWTGLDFFTDILSPLGFVPDAEEQMIPDKSPEVIQTARPVNANLDATHNTQDTGVWSGCDSSSAKRSHKTLDEIVPVGGSLIKFRADIDAKLDHLEHGLEYTVYEATQSLSELDCLGRRLEKLRACWPCLRQSICRAYDDEEEFETNSLAWTFDEMLSWRRALAIAFVNADLLGNMLQDSIDRGREKQEEKLRWRSMTQELLGGLEQAVAARASAVLWFRGSFTEPEKAINALDLNLERVVELEHRLVRCASRIMRVEPEYVVSQQAVRRLSALKRDLHAKADEMTEVRCKLRNPDVGMPYEQLIGVVCRALRRFLETVDDVIDALDGSGYSGELMRGPKGQDLDVFRAWIRNVLLRPSMKDAACESPVTRGASCEKMLSRLARIKAKNATNKPNDTAT